MTDLEIYQLLKYYKGEKDPPSNLNNLQKKWWFGERQFMEEIYNDSNFLTRWKDLYLKALKSGQLSGNLADTGLDETQRLIIFYLDLWHGKWFPYDDFDLIFEY